MKRNGEELLAYIYEELLPQHGMDQDIGQKELALTMYHALQENRIALCEAGTWTERTQACILALIIYRLSAQITEPALIATTTSAIQKPLTEHEIPRISAFLMEQGITDRPQMSVVRKGKQHYVCDFRLAVYRRSVMEHGRREDEKLLQELDRLQRQGCRAADLDGAALTPYVKKRIQVTGCSPSCPMASSCRFAELNRRYLSGYYDFQITNQNYFLADLIRQGKGGKSVFPPFHAIVLDEAHRLEDTARQMYGVTLDLQEPERIRNQARQCISRNQADQGASGRKAVKQKGTGRKCADGRKRARRNKGYSEWMQACDTLIRYEKKLSDRLTDVPQKRDVSSRGQGKTLELILDRMERFYIRQMQAALTELVSCCQNCGAEKRGVRQLERNCRELSDKMEVICTGEDQILWTERQENGSVVLRAVPAVPDRVLFQDLWRRSVAVIVTSATLSVHGSFARYREMTGLNHVAAGRVTETACLSVADHQSRALLYIPEQVPFPNIRNARYIQAVAEELMSLTEILRGHSVILFTSYRLMELVSDELQKRIAEYPFFVRKRGSENVIRDFHGSERGILFTCDDMWEGMWTEETVLDGLIVVRLPFPVPDPVMEYRRRQYGDFEAYKNNVVVPEMLTRLRRWVGNGICRKNDVMVYAILDVRASRGGRYHSVILESLPAMPVTDRITEVKDFVMRKRSADSVERDEDISDRQDGI